MKSIIQALPPLHDARLLGFSMQWEAGILSLDFLIMGEDELDLRIVLRGVTTIDCPREHPWGGPAPYVNEVLQPSAVPEQGDVLELEMQSGDILRFAFQSFELQRLRLSWTDDTSGDGDETSAEPTRLSGIPSSRE